MEVLKAGRIRPQSVKVRSGVLKVVLGGKEDVYDPFERPNLPNAFAKINFDEGSAKRFVERFGPLGFYELADPKLHCGGEPLEWVYAQSDTVRFALDIISGLKDKELRVDLTEVLEGRQQRTYGMKPWMNAVHGVSAGYYLAIGVTSPYSRLYPFRLQNPPARKARVWATDEDIIRQHGRDILSFLVNRNTANLRLELYSSTDKLEFALHFDALIEVIWYLVGIMAGGAQEGRRLDIRLCDNCNLPFVATDGRQKFCPPWYSEESQCAVAHRARTRRRSRKGVVSEGPKGV